METDLVEMKDAAETAVAAEQSAKDQYRAATAARELAHRAYNVALLKSAGVILGQSVFHGFLHDRVRTSRPRRFVCVGGSARFLGYVVLREITKDGSLWPHRRPYTVRFTDITPTGETLPAALGLEE